MGHYHLCQIIPSNLCHGLNGYNEVIQTIEWGLQSLGHSVSYEVNRFLYDTKNIIFGSQLCHKNILETLPKNSIIYNLEQKRWLVSDKPVSEDELDAHTYIADNFEIWDYSTIHLPIWKSLSKSEVKIKHVPIGYAPVLSKIEKAVPQDIDVLIYGTPSDDRLTAFQKICGTGLCTVFICGLYGQARDDLIARSKIVLNISQYDHTFEIVRVSYLLANSKVVVASIHDDSSIEADMAECIRFCPLDSIASLCFGLVNNEAERERLEIIGRQVIERRDIRLILHSVLNG